eukprot:PITA_11904
MASSSKSASTSTSTADGNTYYAFDVFLNHRGSDGKTFASHLYDRLTEHRLRVFLDREEMEKGEELTPQIEGAIRASSVNIAFFSPQYCQSSWCLNELLLMLECKRTKGSTILPIFFHLEPSVLRWTEGEKGVYGQALSSLQNKRNRDGQLRYKPEIIGEWKKALHDVAEISGYELDGKKYNGDESKLLDDVEEDVLKLVPKPPQNVCIYPTGLEEKVQDFEERVLLQQHESGKAKVVGIVGLVGIGKTTLAKEFYNRKKEEYRRSSFVSDVRGNNSRGQLKELQTKLIKELSGKNTEINSTDEGIPLLKTHLPHWHALIILDDVDDVEQLRAFLPVLPANDSLILVTSRDKSVLQMWELIEDPFIYTLEGLSLQHSVELFCWHAFRLPAPPDAAFEQLVNEFVDACGNLPLSLSLIGALLHGEKDPVLWKAKLSEISKIHPMEVQMTPLISYQSLHAEEKMLFLDVACFFVGEDKDTAMMIWEGSGWSASLGLETLRNKHLVEVEVGEVWKYGKRCMVECIGMHGHLRDMGRCLAHEAPSPHRIWSVTENLSDLSLVGGIRDSAERDRRVNELRWRAPHLQESSYVEGVFSVEQPPQLILLRCYNCPDSSFAPNISTKNLRVLHIEGSNLETLWHLESQAPRELRELYIAGSRLPKIPQSIGQLRRLEKVVLRSEKDILSFETLPDEFCQLRSLKHLELHEKGLKSLPESFCYLSRLQHLNLAGCTCFEELPDSCRNLTKLQHIDLSSWMKLRLLPDFFVNLTNLQHINLSYCEELWQLPDSFGNLTNLQHIDLSSCMKLRLLPDSFGYLTNLQHINLSYCEELWQLPDSFGNLTNLQHIDLSSCMKLRLLPDSFGNLTNLQHINLSYCEELWQLPDSFGNLTNLQHIDLSSCMKLRLLPDSFGNLTNLQHINLSYCEELWQFPRFLWESN